MAKDPALDRATLEREYNVRKNRPDFEQIGKDWAARSAAFRDQAGGRLDLAYGPAPRERIDLFSAGRKGAPLLAYIHGGYWQRGDKSAYSFVAAPFLANGVDIAFINYNLCPNGSIPVITAQIRTAIVWLWRHAAALGLAPERFNLGGHSAGGHLTAMGLATDWPAIGSDLPRDLLKSGIPMSGLYDLDPLRETEINEAVGLDAATARDYSPLFKKPATLAPVLATLGGGETAQFHKQTDRLVEEWTKHGIRVERFAEPEVDHFDYVNRLADAKSALFGKVRGWLR
jgi:arylformamidase